MLTLQKIAQSVNHIEHSFSSADLIIKYLSIDTRSIIFPGSTLFFALEGSRKDGHLYIREAYENGCRSFVVNTKFDQTKFPDANFMTTTNIIFSLQEIAALHRNSFQLPMIGITGSNGKTWVKEWLFESLHSAFQIVRSPGSYNSQIGVALSLWNIAEHHNLGVIEAGISHQNEMQRIAELIQPTIGIFTGIGDAHQEGFDSIEQKINEKLKLFESCHIIIYNQDNKLVHSKIKEVYSDKDLLSISEEDSDAHFFVSSKISFSGNTQIKYVYENQFGTFTIPFDDPISIQNSLIIALTNLHLLNDTDAMSQAMSQLSPMDMRLQIVDAIDGSTMINDAYSLDLNSLKWALKKLDVVGQDQKKMLIISDILQHGDDAYDQIAHLVEAHKIDHVIGIGSEIQVLKNKISPRIQQTYFHDTGSFIKERDSISFHKNTILLKGARPFHFEQIAVALSEKSHTVSLHIDFDAMLHNLQYFGRHIPNGTKVMAVIKASAYGSGSVEIARFLSFFKLDYLAVAVIDEGITLRKAGIKLPILVLNPNSASFDELYNWRLEPEVYSLGVLKQCIASAKSLNRKVEIHIKINSGMNRLGFDPESLAELSEELEKHQELVTIKSVFTHLSSSDNQENDSFTKKQRLVFDQMYQKLCQPLDIKPWRHVLNSSGILRFPQYGYEMVRLGIGLYGVGMGSFNEHLKPVHSLRARIIQLRGIKAGEIVGYNNTFEAQKSMHIATVNIGYADGLPRLAGNGQYECLISGQKAPIVGRVCMDMIMCDVSSIEGVCEGMDVWIFNAEQSIEVLSQAVQTIPYEILAQISPRVNRVFQYA